MLHWWYTSPVRHEIVEVRLVKAPGAANLFSGQLLSVGQIMYRVNAYSEVFGNFHCRHHIRVARSYQFICHCIYFSSHNSAFYRSNRLFHGFCKWQFRDFSWSPSIFSLCYLALNRFPTILKMMAREPGLCCKCRSRLDSFQQYHLPRKWSPKG